MAAPFSAKHSSVRPTTDIIRQGRSTLVTTLQMFKILGLNCLATAYVLSVMHLDGVKLGDMQVSLSFSPFCSHRLIQVFICCSTLLMIDDVVIIFDYIF